MYESMIVARAGDLFSEAGLTHDAIVIPTNCVGVAGAGVAKAARDLWPSWNERYKASCVKGVNAGQSVFYLDARDLKKHVVACFTKGSSS
jgi:hypothetical protein